MNEYLGQKLTIFDTMASMKSARITDHHLDKAEAVGSSPSIKHKQTYLTLSSSINYCVEQRPHPTLV